VKNVIIICCHHSVKNKASKQLIEQHYTRK